MNLVTAALVDDSMSMTRMDDEMEAVFTRHRLKKIKPSIMELIRKIDLDDSGFIQKKEVINAINSDLEMPKELKGIMTETHIINIFEILGENGEEELSTEQFVDGLCFVALSDVPIETQHILMLQNRTMSQLSRMETALHAALKLP